MANEKFFARPVAGSLIGAFLGLFLGMIYSVGGFFVDLFTIGLNRGTILAFGALVGMPVIGLVLGFIAGLPLAILRRVFLR